MSDKSNRNGRAFEAIVFHNLIEEITQNKISCKLTERAYTFQKNDIKFFNELSIGDDTDIALRDDYINNSHIVTNWIIKNFNLCSYDFLLLDKLPDSAGRSGDVTDIRIIATKNNIDSELNFSLKNNSDALKHSRIGGVPIWLGYEESSSEYAGYQKDYDNNFNEINNLISEHNLISTKEVTKYNELDNIYPNFKEKEIFNRYYKIIENFFTNFCSTPEKTNMLFRYIIGNRNFYKIINQKKQFVIADYTNIATPTKVEFGRTPKTNYLLLNFNNGWKISIRLHNGDHNLKSKLKVDAKIYKGSPIPLIKLKK